MRLVPGPLFSSSSTSSLWIHSVVVVPLLLLVVFLQFISFVNGCTDLLVTPGASEDGSAMIAYNADSPTLMGMLYHYPRRTTTTTTTESENITTTTETQMLRNIYDWDSGIYLGSIPEIENFTTYNVVGNTNEYGLIIGESTFGGVSILAWNQSGAILDYGSLIYITLQRCKTVSDAITTMVELMDTYGYASGGESFSLTDYSGEVWYMEIISRGSTYSKIGAVYVAMKIPDGMVSAHANQARIGTFPLNDPTNCRYAPDIFDVAIHYGLYVPTDPNSYNDFHFANVFHPLTFMSARQGEARVWSIFSQIVDDDNTFQNEYLHLALGEDLQKRMPLFVKPYKKLNLHDVTRLMSSHYEDTILDSSIDVGSGLFESPYRPRPLTWTYKNEKYHNERSIATAKTGWNIIGQVRPYIPIQQLSTILWFGCDDSSTSPRVPVYSSSTALSPAYYLGGGPQDGIVQPLLQFDMTKAFWIQNMVSNLAYSRWCDIYPIVTERIHSILDGFLDNIAIVDVEAMNIYETSQGDIEQVIHYLTKYSVNAGNTLQKIWMEFYGELFVQYRDSYTIVSKESDVLCGCTAIEPGLSLRMKQRIVTETGEHYRVNDDIQVNNNGKNDEHHGTVVVLDGENGPPLWLDHRSSSPIVVAGTQSRNENNDNNQSKNTFFYY